jgi:enoyl-CoA hydratase
MIEIISRQLTIWEADENIKAVIFKGAGDKAFCAGGDVKAVYHAGLEYHKGQSSFNKAHLFFYHEYRMNRLIYNYSKPLISLLDGITMGGGYGVGGPCRFRVVSEKTIFAMPEIAIGLFTDIGSTFYLNQCPDNMGQFLAVTGSRLSAPEMIYSGLADYYILSSRMKEFEQALADFLVTNDDPLELLDEFSDKFETSLGVDPDYISKIFDGYCVETMVKRLVEADDKLYLPAILSGCPLSIKTSLRHLQMASGRGFNQTVETDFILAQHFMDGTEFFEGVRAMLIDKDKSPKWTPQALSEVDEALLNKYFSPTDWTLEGYSGENEDIKQNFT